MSMITTLTGSAGASGWRLCALAIFRRVVVISLSALTFSSLAIADETPYIPESDSTVLQTVPPDSDPQVKAMNSLRTRLKTHPENIKLAENLARKYIAYSRTQGDIRYLGYAEATLEPWLSQPEKPVSIRVIKANLMQSRHQFAAARKVLQEIIKENPDNIQALLTLSSVGLVQGDFETAHKACTLIAKASGGLNLASGGCFAALTSVTGQADRANRLLNRLLEAAPAMASSNGNKQQPAGVRAWLGGLKADAAKRLGKIKEADAAFRQALSLTPGDNFLLADYADFLLDQSRPQDALKLVKDYGQSDTLFLRQALAKAAMGEPDADRDARIMGDRFAAMDLRGSHLYRREQVRYALHLAHDPQQALRLARQNWKVQRAPWDIRVYMEAALAASQPAAAKPALDLYQSSGLQDPHIASLAEKLQEQLSGRKTAQAADKNN